MSMTMSMSTLPGVGSPLPLGPVTNIERMYALDEAWNALSSRAPITREQGWRPFRRFPTGSLLMTGKPTSSL
jgi:hypothetical protein